MLRIHLPVIVLAMLYTTASAMAATITAKAEDHTITVFSTSDKPERCSANVHFTYLQDGKREPGFTSKEFFTTVPGKDVKVWDFTNPALIAPIIDGAVDAHCGDAAPKK